MYRDDEFYVILDKLRFDMYFATYKNHCTKYERVIVKLFGKDDERVLIETVNGVDEIVKDTRADKTSDLMEYDLLFLKMMERIICDDELPNRIYEYIDGVGAWSRVKIDGFHPDDKKLACFFEKERVIDNDLARRFEVIVKDEVFSKPGEVLNLINRIYCH